MPTAEKKPRPLFGLSEQEIAKPPGSSDISIA